MTTPVRRRPGSRDDDGFSFIELLAYMAIAALLILAAVPQFNQYRQKAAISNVQNDLHNAALAMEGVYVTDQQYPLTLPEFKTSKDVTISDPSADPDGLGAAMQVLKVNTGIPVDVTYSNGSVVTGAQYYFGDKGKQMLRVAFAAHGSPDIPPEIATALNTQVLSYTPQQYVADYAYAINSGARFGIKQTGTAAGYVYYTVGINGITWADAPTIDYTPDSFCLNGSSSEVPGQTWHYDSLTGIAAGACL